MNSADELKGKLRISIKKITELLRRIEEMDDQNYQEEFLKGMVTEELLIINKEMTKIRKEQMIKREQLLEQEINRIKREEELKQKIGKLKINKWELVRRVTF